MSSICALSDECAGVESAAKESASLKTLIHEFRAKAVQACYSDDVASLRRVFRAVDPQSRLLEFVDWNQIDSASESNRCPLLAYAVAFGAAKCTEECLLAGADPNGATVAFQPGAREVLALGGASNARLPPALRTATPLGTGRGLPRDALAAIKESAKNLSLCLDLVIKAGADATDLPLRFMTRARIAGEAGATHERVFERAGAAHVSGARTSRANSGTRSRAASDDAAALPLLSRSSSLEKPLGPFGYPLLPLAHAVAELGLPLPVRALIQRGVDMSVKDAYGWTAAQVALHAAQRAHERNAREVESMLLVFYSAPNPLDALVAQLHVPNAKDRQQFWVLSREESLAQLLVPAPRMRFPLEADAVPPDTQLVWLIPAWTAELAQQAAAFCRITQHEVCDRWGVALKGNAVTARIWQTGVLDGGSVEVMHLEHFLPDGPHGATRGTAETGKDGEDVGEADDDGEADYDDDAPFSRGATVSSAAGGSAAAFRGGIPAAAVRGVKPTHSLGHVVAVFAKVKPPSHESGLQRTPTSESSAPLPRASSFVQPRQSALPPDLPPRPSFPGLQAHSQALAAAAAAAASAASRPTSVRTASHLPPESSSAAVRTTSTAAAATTSAALLASSPGGGEPDAAVDETAAAGATRSAAAAVAELLDAPGKATADSPASALESRDLPHAEPADIPAEPYNVMAIVAGSEAAVSSLAAVLQARWPATAPTRRFVAVPLFAVRAALTGSRDAQTDTRLSPIPLVRLGRSATAGAAALWRAGESPAFGTAPGGVQVLLGHTWSSILSKFGDKDPITAALRALKPQSESAAASRQSSAVAPPSGPALPADANELFALAYLTRVRPPTASGADELTGASLAAGSDGAIGGAGAGHASLGRALTQAVRCRLPFGFVPDPKDRRGAVPRVLLEETGVVIGAAVASTPAGATVPAASAGSSLSASASERADACIAGVLPFDPGVFIQLLRPSNEA